MKTKSVRILVTYRVDHLNDLSLGEAVHSIRTALEEHSGHFPGDSVQYRFAATSTKLHTEPKKK